MTVLGTATRVYAGGTAAVAVYAGSVKVWPSAPPPPAVDGHGSWAIAAPALNLNIDRAAAPGTWTIDIGPYPGPVFNPTAYLGQGATTGESRTFWAGTPVTWSPSSHITNADAVAQWAGKRVVFTLDGSSRITAVTVLGPTP
jgi:hypothetical protein